MRGSIAVALLLPLMLAGARAEPDPTMKAGSVLHRTSKKHAHPYSLYVPSNYSPKVSWPLVVSSHGRGGAGRKEIGQWTGLAKEFGFIVACPDMCTATVNRPPNSKLEPSVEDEQVVLSIYEEVAGSFRVNPRAVMLTGFSGGGNPSYWTGLRHPDLVTHICTRGGNFAIQQIPRAENLLAAGRKTIRIYIYYGENDHPLILGKDGETGQAQGAYDALTKAGYEHVAIEKIAGMKHQSRPRIAAEWFGGFLKANRKRFLAGDKADGILEKARAAMAKEKYRNALRELKKLAALEGKEGLAARSEAEFAAVQKVAEGMIAEAKLAHDGDDTKEAMKILGKVARDFKGVPAADEAKRLKKEWME